MTGATGAQGANGGIGPQGLVGAAGAQGATGAQGTAGSAGAAGSQGLRGLQGAPGATGATGAAGSAGPQGSQGFQGAAGGAGPQGTQGEQGSVAGALARFSNTAAQGSIAANTIVNLNSNDVNTATEFISRSGNSITLAPGTYALSGSIGGVTGVAGGASVYFGFYSVTNGAWIGQGGANESSNLADNDAGPEGPATVAFTTTSVITVQLRLVSVTAANQISSPLDFGTAASIGLGRTWVQIVRY
ncbi:hypothetical protein [Agromyces seonyuensis]|uniref:hypothetical protein n=1 Tax=Agromyces seonyuensis TaxID=2662446 RepID=UPI00192074B2|nr:hypothetical protein [Agromyces seonyuensis]